LTRLPMAYYTAGQLGFKYTAAFPKSSVFIGISCVEPTSAVLMGYYYGLLYENRSGHMNVHK